MYSFLVWGGKLGGALQICRSRLRGRSSKTAKQTSANFYKLQKPPAAPALPADPAARTPLGATLSNLFKILADFFINRNFIKITRLRTPPNVSDIWPLGAPGANFNSCIVTMATDVLLLPHFSTAPARQNGRSSIRSSCCCVGSWRPSSARRQHLRSSFRLKFRCFGYNMVDAIPALHAVASRRTKNTKVNFEGA